MYDETYDEDLAVVDHVHTYRADISDWWCVDCDTVTDYCQQLNPF